MLMELNSYSDEDIEKVDLVGDAVYREHKIAKGGIAGPFVTLLGVSRQGGFRYRGTYDHHTPLSVDTFRPFRRSRWNVPELVPTIVGVDARRS